MTTTNRRQPSEPAVAAAIETGCRTLRLPTIRTGSQRSPPPPNASS